MKVQDIMTTKVESVSPTSTLRQAARKMRELDVGSLLVMEDGQLRGIITDRDISCYAVAIGRDPNWTDVQKVMVTHIATCFDDDEIADAAHLMEDRHIRRLPVLTHDNKVAGVLSVDDLARNDRELAGAVLEAAIPVH
jgi:CBS domain-containing protein